MGKKYFRKYKNSETAESICKTNFLAQSFEVKFLMRTMIFDPENMDIWQGQVEIGIRRANFVLALLLLASLLHMH